MKHSFSTIATATCLAMLVACSHQLPAPVEEHSSSQVKQNLNPDGSYDVRSGDTLYALAFSHGLDHRDVATWNSISSPYVIYPGQNLRLSSPPGGSRYNRADSASVQTSGIKTPSAATTRSH